MNISSNLQHQLQLSHDGISFIIFLVFLLIISEPKENVNRDYTLHRARRKEDRHGNARARLSTVSVINNSTNI